MAFSFRIGVTLAVFHAEGMVPDWSEKLKICDVIVYMYYVACDRRCCRGQLQCLFRE